MNALKRLWTKLRFVEGLEGMDDPIGSYMFSLKKRVDKLEHGLDRLERQLHSRPGGGAVHDIYEGSTNSSESRARRP